MSNITKTNNIELELDDNSILSNLFGINDSNLSIIEKINNVMLIIEKINILLILSIVIDIEML